MENKKPTTGNGKICYVEIPANDIEASANFYHAVFGWKLRKRSEGDISFDDGVGEVSGMWVLNRPPMTEAGLVISIMVDDAVETMESVKVYGGKVIYSTTMNTGEVIAHFTDPAGNVMGIYQESSQENIDLPL